MNFKIFGKSLIATRSPQCKLDSFLLNISYIIRYIHKMRRILNVAEKNDAAKSIAELMSHGTYRKVGIFRIKHLLHYHRIITISITLCFH